MIRLSFYPVYNESGNILIQIKKEAYVIFQNDAYTFYAIIHELNGREFNKRLKRYPEDQHFMVMLANSIIGTEHAKRVTEIPETIVMGSDAFVSKLLQFTDNEKIYLLKEIFEELLIITLEDELRFCCPNCTRFRICTDIVNLNIGELFKRRVKGEESNHLREEIKSRISIALENAPYYDSDDAHEQCEDFEHQYDSSSLGNVFNRYRDIALDLHQRFGLDYGSFQQKLIEINMDFVKRAVDA